jgi:hypothetical protein
LVIVDSVKKSWKSLDKIRSYYMRLKISIILIVLCELILTGCGTNNQVSSNFTPQGGAPSEGGNGRETPLALRLALGTFKLDKTDYPITAEQAKALLPLWKAASALSKSETAASQEIQALVNQIQNTLSPEQRKAIDDMGLSFRDMSSIAEEFGLDFGSGGFGNMSPEMRAIMEAARASGQRPPGGFGGPGFPGGGPGGPGEGFGGQSRGTATVTRSGTGFGLPSSLYDAIIKFLEAKVQ